MNPTRAANCLILLLQAYIVKLATNREFVPIVIVGVVASVFFLTKAWQLQPKRLLIATVAIPWICLVRYQLWPPESILHALGEWLLLTSGALALWGPITYRGWRLGPLLAFGCGCCFFAACEPSSMLASSLRPLVIAHVIAFSICQNLQAVPNTGHQNSYTRIVLLSLLVMVAALGSWSLADAWADNAAQLQRWLNDQVTWASGRSSRLRGYVRIGQLDSIRKEQTSDPERVAIKVYANSAPGYMRGRAFDTYDGGHWRSHRRRRNRWNRTWTNRNVQPMIVAPDGLPSPERGESQFALRPSSGPWIRYEVWNDPDRGEMFFTTLRTSILFGTGTYVSLDEHEIVHSGISSREPYTLFVDRRATESVAPELRQLLTSPMYRADSQLIQTLSDRLCRDATTISEKIAAVRGYFRSEFEYSLDPVALPSGKDRLDFFLESRPAAHCEYFATATVALLRAQDIPARFVTGYVVTELEDEYEDYWLARNRNAHAWAEAFDEDNQRWVIVESTPSMPLLEEAEERTNQRQVAESEGGENLLRMVRGGGLAAYFARLVTWFRRRIAESTTMLTILAICVVGLLWPRIKRRYELRRHPERARLVEGRRLLDRVDRNTKKHGYARTQAETLHQFADRIDVAAPENLWLSSAARWYRRYAEQRYRSQLDLDDLRQTAPTKRAPTKTEP